jgi:hypothetical protein
VAGKNHVQSAEILYFKVLSKIQFGENTGINAYGEEKQEGYLKMEKKNILMLIVSAILVAGVSIAGCTQDSESSSNGDSSSSPAQILSPSSGNTEMKDNDQPAFN